MLVRYWDFSDVLERTMYGGVHVETHENGDETWSTSEEASVWLHVTIMGIEVLKVEAGLLLRQLIEND